MYLMDIWSLQGLPVCEDNDDDDDLDIASLGASVRTVGGVKCRKLPPCPDPNASDGGSGGSSILNLRSRW